MTFMIWGVAMCHDRLAEPFKIRVKQRKTRPQDELGDVGFFYTATVVA